MPTVPDVIRLQTRGSILGVVGGSPIEEFVHTTHWLFADAALLNATNDPDAAWQEAMGDFINFAVDAWETRWTGLVPGQATAIRTRFPPTVRYDEMRAYHLNAGGLTEHLASGLITDAPQGSGDVSLPPQCAVAVSLYAYEAGEFNPHGRRGRGRFYLPPMSRTQVDHPGVLVAGAMTAVRDWQLAFLGAIDGSDTGAGGTTQLVLAGNDGVARDPVRLRVGRVVDTQRRRRSSIDEQYTEGSL